MSDKMSGTVRINTKMWEKAESAAVDATILRRTPVQISEVLRFILEENLDEGIKDFLAKEKNNKK